MKVFKFYDREGDLVGSTTDQIRAQSFKQAHPDYSMETTEDQNATIHCDLPQQTQ